MTMPVTAQIGSHSVGSNAEDDAHRYWMQAALAKAAAETNATVVGGMVLGWRGPTPELRGPVALPSTWWRTLRESLRTLAVVPTSRTYLTEHEVARRLRVFFGDRADPTVSEWTAAHTDLHWTNLSAPCLVLVDWEGWGMAPAGFDAATLDLAVPLHHNAERVLRRLRGRR